MAASLPVVVQVEPEALGVMVSPVVLTALLVRQQSLELAQVWTVRR